MKSLSERIADISVYLHSLTAPEFSTNVQDAVQKKDRNSLIQICKNAKIPTSYTGTIVSFLLSVSPEQKWPADV
jgi:hypothetical protein